MNIIRSGSGLPRSACLALSIALAIAMPAGAWAQDAPTQQDDEEETDIDAEAAAAVAEEQPEPATLDAITVTGSRIRRAGFDTLEPASVLTRDYIDARGQTNVAEALNEIPGFGAGVTPEGAQSGFGVGVNFVNRFGLGTNRTLTLVNGRRFVSANTATIFGPAVPGLQVDLNTIPTAMIDRVENLTIGGAPTYGSDAIAGTVNVILRRDFEGIDVRGTYGLTEQGDNERIGGAIVFGRNFLDDRGNVTLGLTVDNTEGVLQTEREQFRQALFFSPNPNQALIDIFQPDRDPRFDGRFNTGIPFNTGSADGIPNAVLIRNRRIFSTPPGGLVAPNGFPFNPDGSLQGLGPDGDTYLAFDRSGSLVPYDTGFNFGLVDASGGDGLSLVELGQITSDLDRTTANALATFDITDNVELFFEGTYYEAESLELIAQPIFNSPLFGGLSAPIQVSVTHPLLTDQARAALAANGVTDAFFLSRASRDLVTNNASSETETARGVLGLTGDFEIGERFFYWEVYANHGRTEANFFQTVLNQQNFINAINVSRNASGQVVCDPDAGSAGYANPALNTPVADPNCVPLDLFGEGRPSEAARNYITGRTNARSVIEQQVYNANISSELFDTWAGPIEYNVGFERRIERAAFTPDTFQQEGLGRAVPITPTTGSFATKEAFAELLLPLASADNEIPLLHRLDLTGKFRRVDNTVNDEFDAYTYGFQWEPVEGFLLRSNFTRSLRAPAVTELFTPTAEIFTFVPDSCDTRLVNSGTRPDVRARNCAAFYEQFGLDPDDFTSIAVSATIRGTLGGDPNLENESSDAFTYGFVWTPEVVPGLTIAADYYRIEIDNVIANLGAADIASGCFDNDDFDASDVTTANQFCERIVRLPNGQIDTIRTGFVNGAFLDFEGREVQINYQRETSLGTFDLGANLFFLSELRDSNNGIVEDEDAGEIGNSKRQFQFNLGWQGERLGLTLSQNYTGDAKFNNTFTPESQDILEVNGYWLTNLGASYQVTDNGILRFAVTNAFDREPPFPTIGFGTYDQLGRRYTLTAQWRF